MDSFVKHTSKHSIDKAYHIDLLINCSEIAIITGDNQFKSKRDYLIDVWKKNAKKDYEIYKNMTQFVKVTDEDKIRDISAKNNINIEEEMKKCVQTKNTTDLNNMQKIIFDKMQNLSNHEKKIITESVKNVTNTKFGIKNEFDVTKLYESKTGSIIEKDNKYHKKIVYEDLENNICISIGGKIDGINKTNRSIIEVKNRMHKLFYTLREYEKVQIMCYMYIHDSNNGHLVEAHKKKDGTDINIIEVAYDSLYMDNIINKIRKFAKFYGKFIVNHEMKINLLKDENMTDLF